MQRHQNKLITGQARTRTTKLLLLGFAALSGLHCTPNKADVEEEWEDVEKQRIKAEKTTADYEARRKKDYQKDTEKRIEGQEAKLASLRASTVKAVGNEKSQLQDKVWDLERRLSEARNDLETLKRRGPEGWDASKQNLDDKLAEIDMVVAEGEVLAH